MQEPNAIVLDLSGDKFLASFLDGLPQKVLDRVVKTAFKVPAKRIMEAARRLAPVKSGFLKKQIKVRNLRKRKGFVGVRVGTSEVEYTGKAFYAYFQEYGWKQGKRPFRTKTPERFRAQRLAEKEKLLGQGERLVLDPGLSAKARQRLQKKFHEKQARKRAKLLEQTKDLRKAISGDTRRQIPPKFYFRRAFDANANITKKEMRDELVLAVEAETEKAAKQSQREADKAKAA